MRVLWITSRPIAGTCGTSNSASSGSWLDAAYESCKTCGEITIDVASLGNVPDITRFNDGDSRLYLLPGGGDVNYDINSRKNILQWEKLRKEVAPDVVQIWGTEKSYYLLAQKTFHDVPSVVYIQGVITKIAEDYSAGLSEWIKLINTSIQDIYRGTWINRTQRRFRRMAQMEQQILRSSYGIIVENDWCEDQMNAISPGKKIFRSKLPIKQVFFDKDWNIKNVVHHSIFTNAGAAPIKGHHILFKALSIVKRDFPDVKVIIPGFSRMGNSFKDRIGRNGYSRYLSKLIRRYHLEDNIKYAGVLNSEGMADMIAKCNVFVMPSCIENHSSSLIEAMIVGAPCVSSFVGGVGSVAIHNKNALLYNYPDAEALAGHICRVLRNPELAVSLSNNAKAIRADRSVNIGEDFISIYHTILENEGKE